MPPFSITLTATSRNCRRISGCAPDFWNARGGRMEGEDATISHGEQGGGQARAAAATDRQADRAAVGSRGGGGVHGSAGVARPAPARDAAGDRAGTGPALGAVAGEGARGPGAGKQGSGPAAGGGWRAGELSGLWGAAA